MPAMRTRVPLVQRRVSPSVMLATMQVKPPPVFGSLNSKPVWGAPGEGLAKRDPAYTVRERLVTLGKSRGDKTHVIFRGWNAFRQNQKLTIVKIVGTNLPALI